MVAFGWLVLTLVFVDEVLALVGLGVWGWSTSASWLLVWVAPFLGIVVWFFCASPEARFSGPVIRPVAKVIVFGSACLGLWAAGHTTAAIALLLFSVAINALAFLPDIRELAASLES